MSKQGGKRAGAGRPIGSQNVATSEQKIRLSDLARVHCEGAISTLVEIMENGSSENARIVAATSILDRGYGRPIKVSAQDMTPKNEDPLADLIF